MFVSEAFGVVGKQFNGELFERMTRLQVVFKDLELCDLFVAQSDLVLIKGDSYVSEEICFVLDELIKKLEFHEDEVIRSKIFIDDFDEFQPIF